MPHRPPADPAAELVPAAVAARLFARASELDAAGSGGAPLSQLRAAAAEAGISARAFEAALAEGRAAGEVGESVVPAPHRRLSRGRLLAAALITVLVIGALAVTRPWASAGVGPPVVEEAFLLRCLSPGEAAELVRPLLGLRTNTVVISPEHAPRVLTIRGTPDQLREVRALLDRYEAAGSAACPVAP